MHPDNQDQIIEIKRQGHVVARSTNLQGILDYARRKGVSRISVTRRQTDGGLLIVSFADGATCATRFESFDMAIYWVEVQRTWELSPELSTENLYSWVEEPTEEHFPAICSFCNGTGEGRSSGSCRDCRGMGEIP